MSNIGEGGGNRAHLQLSPEIVRDWGGGITGEAATGEEGPLLQESQEKGCI